MWTSRGTLQRALPSNNTRAGGDSPRRATRISVLLPVLVIALLGGESLGAQEADDRRAILLEGPNRVRGIRGLGPNALAAQRGVYELHDGGEVEIFILALFVDRPDEWNGFSCPALAAPEIALTVTEEHGRPIYAYRSREEGRTILGVGFESPEVSCDFLVAFLDELSFFSSALQSSPLLPFPAVLTY